MKNSSLEQGFVKVYSKFKLNFYRKVLSGFQSREASLTTVETFCMEIIHSLDNPTVNEFASFTGISPPNAAYKVNNLIQKGYVKKTRSSEDRREYYLTPTEKYYNYYNISQNYVKTVVSRVNERFTEAEIKQFSKMLFIISDELMPEINITKS